MKRMQTNLAMAAVVVGLSAAVWFSQKKEEKLPPLTSLKADQISTIAIDHPGHPQIKLERKDEHWRLVAPIQAPTDPFEVSSLVGLASLEVQRSLKRSEVSPKELKLDPPQYTIKLNDTVIGFGDKEPIKYRRYVSVGDTVALVADPPSAALDENYSDLVAKKVLPEGAVIERIDVPGLSVVRSADGQAWTSPDHPDVDSARLQTFVDAWQKAKAMWNAAQPEDEKSAGEPVRIQLKNGVVQLSIAARKPQLKLDRADWHLQYTLSVSDADTLLALPAPPKQKAKAADAKASDKTGVAPAKPAS